jgi:hypothetical protein
MLVDTKDARRQRRPLALAIFALSACGGRDTGDLESITVRDSAGVSIVESKRPKLPAEAGWTVDSAPQLSIGTVEGEDPYLLSGVVSVDVLPDGRILVAHRADHTLRFYTAAGQFLTSAGRQGDGPGEFAFIGTPYVRGDEIIVMPTNVYQTIERFDLEGNPTGSSRLQPLPAQFGLGVRGLLADGSPVLAVFPQGSDAQRPARGVITLEMPIYFIPPDGGRIDSLTSVAAVNYVEVGLPAMTMQQFGPTGQVAVGDSHVYVGWTESPEVKVVDTGGNLVRIQRWQGITRPITAEDRSAWYQEYLSGLDGAAEAFIRQRQMIADGMVFPISYPTFGRMLLDGEGWLWVQHYDLEESPPIWDVFDPNGAWVSTVETPVGLSIMSIGSDYVAGVWRDEFDVEFVRLHRLLRVED